MGINYRVQDPNRPSNKELLTSGKGVSGDRRSEGSQTVKSCTEEHEPHTEAGLVRTRWHVTPKSKILRTTRCVDVAAIGGKLVSLPGEISSTTGW